MADNEAVNLQRPEFLSNPDRPLRVMQFAVNLGFGVLLALSAYRYFTNHTLEGKGLWVATLAAGTALAYAFAVIGPVSPTRRTIGILSATALWLPLTIVAPSFSWCAFALIFAVHQVLPRVPALVLSTVVIAAVSLGLFWMSGASDPVLVLGPIAGGIVILTTFAALNQALNNTRRLTEELRATSAQLAKAEREAGVLAERNRFASELHDTVVQRTASALLLLESSAESSAAPNAEAARDVLRESLVETRQLLHGMRQQPHLSLATALHEAAQQHGADFTVHGDQRDLSDEVSHALTRVTSEALINAAKHAGTAQKHVTLTYFPGATGEVGVDIADDGAGFDAVTASATAEGFGLRAMQWRVESLGGSFSIETAPGQGTVIAAIVPTTPDASTAPTIEVTP